MTSRYGINFQHCISCLIILPFRRALCVSASRETYKQIVNFKTENKLSWKELYRDYGIPHSIFVY